MRKRQRSMLALVIVAAFAAIALLFPVLIHAGDLEPAGPPEPTMHTLDEIYHKLDQIAQGTALPKTGQITCYDTAGNVIDCSGTGQDGEYQRGVAWPNPRFTDKGDGTVTDNLTGLIWLKQANYNSTSGTTGYTTWANALSFCNALQSGQCGLTDGSVAGDWRLPNVREMQSLCDYGFYNPALSNTAGTGKWSQGDPFTNVQSHYYWSTTTDASVTDLAWCVYLYNGNVDDNNKISMFYVWPVRGGQY